MKQIRWLAMMSLVGGITAVPLLIVFAQTGWGTPGTAIDITIWRSRIWPRWSALILLLALPLDIVAYCGSMRFF